MTDREKQNLEVEAIILKRESMRLSEKAEQAFIVFQDQAANALRHEFDDMRKRSIDICRQLKEAK